MPWPHILFPVFVVGLQIAGHTEHFDAAGDRIIMAYPGSIVGHGLRCIGKNGRDLLLKLRRQL